MTAEEVSLLSGSEASAVGISAVVPLVDTKLISKPSTFGKKETEWKDWRFTLENYLACVDPPRGPNFIDEMTATVNQQAPLDDSSWTEPQRRR